MTTMDAATIRVRTVIAQVVVTVGANIHVEARGVASDRDSDPAVSGREVLAQDSVRTHRSDVVEAAAAAAAAAMYVRRSCCCSKASQCTATN